jgi:hypothetical protein
MIKAFLRSSNVLENVKTLEQPSKQNTPLEVSTREPDRKGIHNRRHVASLAFCANVANITLLNQRVLDERLGEHRRSVTVDIPEKYKPVLMKVVE